MFKSTMKKYSRTGTPGRKNGILLMHNELRQLRNVLMSMLKEQEQSKEREMEREKEKEKANQIKHKTKTQKLKQRPTARIRSKSKRTSTDSSGQLHDNDDQTDTPVSHRHVSSINNEIIFKQARRIEEQKEKLHRIKLYYERQVANIKCSAQLLECQLNKLRAVLQEHLEQNPNPLYIDRYYNKIIYAVDKMQSQGINIYDSSMVSQSPPKTNNYWNSSLTSMQPGYIVDNVQEVKNSNQLEHCPKCAHNYSI